MSMPVVGQDLPNNEIDGPVGRAGLSRDNVHVLRRTMDKFLNRDLAARSNALLDESKALVARTDDLLRRNRRVEDRLVEARREHDHLRGELKLAAQTRDEALMSRLEALTAKLDLGDLEAEAAAVAADVDLLARDQRRIKDGLDAINTVMRKRTVRVAQVGIAATLLAVAIGLLLPPFSAKTAHGTHLDYYAAVAGITPVFLVAGFVEIALLSGLGAGAWGVISFGIPAVGAGSAALDVLATHHSTASTLYLTIWGLFSTLALLILYVVAHASRGTSG